MTFVDPKVTQTRVRVRCSTSAGETPIVGELRIGEVAANAADGTLHVGLTSGAASTLPSATGITKIVKITQAAYDALASKDATTLYVIT